MSTVKIKRSGTTTSTPSSLDYGELAINYADATLFWKDSSNVIQSFVFQAYASATHASSHATGGSDALTPADIGAAPAASPTFTGVITVSATSGSAGSYAPSLTISGDANTGFGQVSGQSDTASIFTAGSERVRVDSSGRVGIGRTPSIDGTSLECANDIFLAATKSLFLYHANKGAGIGTPSNINFQIWARSDITDSIQFQGRHGTTGAFTDYLRIVTGGTSAGNVGVGTTSPTALLDINSDTMRLRTARTPASATAAGNAGDICWDANFVYVCTATNTWRKARLSADGQTFTGTTTFNGPIVEGRVVGGNTGTAKTIALTNGTLQDYTLTGNCTFTMPTATAGQSFTLMLRTGAGSYTATFTGVKWPGSTAPTVTTTASRMDLFSFVSDGTNWYGSVVQGYTP